ncbi:uncharacterized protein At4g26450 [Nicotiana tabacum]|uniref:uncharacterized protein At4g26450 n=1 Tax=Nicotiana tabacum TaxID=4097 RepID=UPI003F4E534E
MHARHRSPVAGYKSSSMGMGGVATASRVSPEETVRGRGLHNLEYRNYNRGGFGRGQSKQFGFQQPSHGNDLFMEAGRLAAEYLVSKGLLPPNALSGKLPNGNLKSPVGNFQGFKRQDVDEGRTSALSRFESGVGDRRMYPDEHNSVGSRNYMRARRRNESFRNYISEFNQELQRSGSSVRARAYTDMNGQDVAFPRDRDEQQVAKDSNEMLPSSLLPGKTNPDIESTEESTGGDSKPASGDSGKETSPINTGNDIPSEVQPEPNEKPDDIEMSEKEADPVNLSNSTEGLEKTAGNEDLEVKLFSEEHNQTSMTANDLLSLCRFGNVPTRTRSSLANRDLKVCHDSVTVDENAHEGGLPKETEVHSQDISVDAKSLNSEKLKAPSMEEESCLTYAIKQLNETSSLSFRESTLMKEEEKLEGLTEIESCSSITTGRGEKRELDDDDNCKEGTKRPRELASLKSTFSDDFLYRSNSVEEQLTSQEPRTSQGEPVMFLSEEKRLVDISMIPEGDVRLGSDFTEKQLLPASFKTFDLNLMETSDVNEHHDANPVHIFPVIAEGVKQEASVDMHLTMGSNSNTSKYAKSGFDGRDVEVIDLDNDSEQEEKAFSNQERRSEVVFTETDDFSNNAHSTNNIPNAQDGYGLMISELLGNDIANCSSLPEDMNSLHNDMGLHNGEGMLGDDDSIYMSLGEIPISFLTGWEQPTQEFGKPF